MTNLKLADLFGWQLEYIRICGAVEHFGNSMIKSSYPLLVEALYAMILMVLLDGDWAK